MLHEGLSLEPASAPVGDSDRVFNTPFRPEAEFSDEYAAPQASSRQVPTQGPNMMLRAQFSCCRAMKLTYRCTLLSTDETGAIPMFFFSKDYLGFAVLLSATKAATPVNGKLKVRCLLDKPPPII